MFNWYKRSFIFPDIPSRDFLYPINFDPNNKHYKNMFFKLIIITNDTINTRLINIIKINIKKLKVDV